VLTVPFAGTCVSKAAPFRYIQ